MSICYVPGSKEKSLTARFLVWLCHKTDKDCLISMCDMVISLKFVKTDLSDCPALSLIGQLIPVPICDGAFKCCYPINYYVLKSC